MYSVQNKNTLLPLVAYTGSTLFALSSLQYVGVSLKECKNYFLAVTTGLPLTVILSTKISNSYVLGFALFFPGFASAILLKKELFKKNFFKKE